ncbi:MAG TPA: OsmC family peroxiredoxin [Planctomycetes bacterium]|nr:OsmC family peroxiredoxin [Planctomycetota bacterium]
MVEIHARYEGELHCEATHGPSNAVLHTDAPVDNHGRGRSFSPTDLVGTALGTCMVTIMGIAAERHGWDIRGTRVRVVKHMCADPVRRIERLEVEITVPGEHDERARDLLRKAASGCPVWASLHPDVTVELTLAFGSD